MLGSRNDTKKSLNKKYKELKRLRLELETMESNFIEDLSNHFNLKSIIKMYGEGDFDETMSLDHFHGDGYGITLDGHNHNTIENVIDCIGSPISEQVKVCIEDAFF